VTYLSCGLSVFCFFCVLVQKGRILRATGRILWISWPESPDLYPESPGPADRNTFYWVDNMSYASHIFLALTCSPHCKTYMSFCVSLDKYANCWHVKSKLKFKVHGIHLGGSSYMLDVYRFMIIKWVTCGLSSITKKGEIESDLGP